MKKETQEDQFVRIAMAQLRSVYGFKPQRSAMAAHMYRRWLDRQIAQ